MNRSLPFAQLAIKVVFGVAVVTAPMTSAHADLDDLLGDWADAAASEVDSQDANDVSLTPASAMESLVSQAPADDQFAAADWAASESDMNQLDAGVPPLPSLVESKPMPETLTGHNQVHYGISHGGHSVLESAIPSDLYHVASATANPYVPSSHGQCGCNAGSCGCESRIVECGSGGCGFSKFAKGAGGCSSCGQLVESCEIDGIEGKSECRPHREPNLPPPSTFLNLFRSRNTYTDVWVGYAEETRLRARNRSPHLDGTWRCRGCGALVEQENNTCGCGCGH